MDGAGTNSDAIWYVWVNDRQFGPVDIGQLRTLKEKGLLQSDHWVLRAGSEDWMVAANIPNLFETIPRATTAPSFKVERLLEPPSDDRELPMDEAVAPAQTNRHGKNY